MAVINKITVDNTTYDISSNYNNLSDLPFEKRSSIITLRDALNYNFEATDSGPATCVTSGGGIDFGFNFNSGITYQVMWDGIVYEITCTKNYELGDYGAFTAGEIPFYISSEPGIGYHIFTNDSSGSHEIAFYQVMYEYNVSWFPVIQITDFNALEDAQAQSIIKQFNMGIKVIFVESEGASYDIISAQNDLNYRYTFLYVAHSGGTSGYIYKYTGNKDEGYKQYMMALTFEQVT